MKFYAVAVGRTPGVYTDWATTSSMVSGYQGARYKSFPTLYLAKEFIAANSGSKPSYNQTRTQINPALHSICNVESSESVLPVETPTRQPGEIWVYTDGSFKDNACGYGIVVLTDEKQYEICGPVPLPPTNNVAELYAMYVILSMLRDYDLTIHSDSQYSIGCVTTWISGWMRNGWKTSNGQPVKNQELIKAIYDLLPGRTVKFVHVKSHCGIEHNELADMLANQGRLGETINTLD